MRTLTSPGRPDGVDQKLSTQASDDFAPGTGGPPNLTGSNGGTTWILLVLIFLGAMAICFRSSLASGGTLAWGDRLDGRLILGLIEHWKMVFEGDAVWHSPVFFYPQEGTLGYSDAYFLYGIPFAILRWIGLDEFAALLGLQIFLATLGYWGMALLLWKPLRFHPAAAAFAGAAFLWYSPLQVSVLNSHLQSLAVWLLPWLVWCLVKSGKAWQAGRRIFIFWIALFATVYALLAFTAFYTAWFFLFLLGLVLALALCLALWRHGWFVLWSELRRRTPLLIGGTICASMAGGLAMTPFLRLYLPTLDANGPQPFAQASLPVLSDFWNTGPDSLFWGWLSVACGRAYAPPIPHEIRMGLPVLTLLAFLLWTVHLWRHRASFPSWAVLLTTGIFLAWLLLWRVHAWTLWRLVYAFVPGAEALRVFFRFNVVLGAVVLPLLALGLSSLLKRLPGATAWGVAFLSMVAFLADHWQLKAPGVLDRRQENTLLTRWENIRSDTPFYFGGPFPSDMHPIAIHMDAFRLAQRWRVPTINGYSGYWPQGFPMAAVQLSNYEARLAGWLLQKGWDGPVLRLGWQDGSRQLLMISDLLQPYRWGESIDVGQGFAYAAEGWSAEEPGWGRWTAQPEASILVPIAQKPSQLTQLALDCEAFLAPRLPRQRLILHAANRSLGTWSFSPQHNRQWIKVDLTPGDYREGARCLLELRLHLPDAVVPAKVSEIKDHRLLGIVLHEFVIYPAPDPN